MTKAKLLHAQKITAQWFEAVEKNNLIIAGKTESQLSAEIIELGLHQFGLTDHWHKKIVRSGENTLCIYPDNPPDRIIEEGDIVFIDFGPIVDGYEADLGRTYVLGKDEAKLKVQHDVEKAWYETQRWINSQTSVKASVIFQYVLEKANEYGWEFSGIIAGHILGKYPHEQPEDPKSWELDIHPENHNDIFMSDANGEKRHWVLELQFVNKEKKIGGYFEQLL